MNVSDALDDLVKSAGEGSRGGKIIGHTSSGKPIYGEKHSLEDHDDEAEDIAALRSLQNKRSSEKPKPAPAPKKHSLEDHDDEAEDIMAMRATRKSEDALDDLVKSIKKATPMGVEEIKVDENGIPLHCGDASEVHESADKVTVRELIAAGVIDPEHEMDKRVPRVISQLGLVY
jgi:hypothetical protein